MNQFFSDIHQDSQAGTNSHPFASRSNTSAGNLNSSSVPGTDIDSRLSGLSSASSHRTDARSVLATTAERLDEDLDPYDPYIQVTEPQFMRRSDQENMLSFVFEGGPSIVMLSYMDPIDPFKLPNLICKVLTKRAETGSQQSITLAAGRYTKEDDTVAISALSEDLSSGVKDLKERQSAQEDHEKQITGTHTGDPINLHVFRNRLIEGFESMNIVGIASNPHYREALQEYISQTSTDGVI